MPVLQMRKSRLSPGQAHTAPRSAPHWGCFAVSCLIPGSQILSPSSRLRRVLCRDPGVSVYMP